MSSKTFILCPGQGAQVVGMGKDFYESSPSSKEVFDTANDCLGIDLKSLCFEGPEDRLNQTDISQPAIYTTSIAAYRAGVEAGVIDPSVVTAYAGLSLGEYTALHLAGVFSFEAGLRLVAARGRYMQEAAVATPRVPCTRSSGGGQLQCAGTDCCQRQQRGVRARVESRGSGGVQGHRVESCRSVSQSVDAKRRGSNEN